METINTATDPSRAGVPVQGGISWFNFLYFTIGATYSIDGGSDILVTNYEGIRAPKGRHFDTVTFKGRLIAKVGRPSDEYPGNGSGPIAPQPSYVFSVNFQAWSAVASGFLAIQAGPKLVQRVRRITLMNPGADGVGSYRPISFAVYSPGTGGLAGNQIGPSKYDKLDDAYSGKAFAGPTGLGVNLTGTQLFNVWVPAVAGPFVPIVLFDDKQGYLKTPTLNPGPLNGANGADVFYIVDGGGNAGVVAPSFLVEVTESPF